MSRIRKQLVDTCYYDFLGQAKLQGGELIDCILPSSSLGRETLAKCKVYTSLVRYKEKGDVYSCITYRRSYIKAEIMGIEVRVFLNQDYIECEIYDECEGDDGDDI